MKLEEARIINLRELNRIIAIAEIDGEYGAAKALKRFKESFKEVGPYEVLSLKADEYTEFTFVLRENGLYSTTEKGSQTLESLLYHNWKIKSIRRISDNEIFSIGDECTSGIIVGFKFEEEGIPFSGGLGIKFDNEDVITILDVEKVKRPLFVTHDGYEMFEGDDYLAVDPEDLSLVWSVADKESLKSKWLKFANRKSAKEYVFWNAPVLSLKDVASIYPGINKEHNTPSRQAEQLKALVKSRL